jgi:hypothetical protein
VITGTDVAAVATVGSTIVGALGVKYGGRNAARDRESRERETQANRDHERRMRHDDRTDDARREFFIELVVYLNEWLEVVQRASPLITSTETEEPAVPEPAEPHDGPRMTARMAVFGTEELDAALGSAMDAIYAFRGFDWSYKAIVRQAGPTDLQALQARGGLETARAAVKERVIAVEHLIRDLLAPPS